MGPWKLRLLVPLALGAFACLSSGKGDSPHLCEAPYGPFRQMGTVPFFRPRRAGVEDRVAEQIVRQRPALANQFPPTDMGGVAGDNHRARKPHQRADRVFS
jgi:hypothetical protein